MSARRRQETLERFSVPLTKQPASTSTPVVTGEASGAPAAEVETSSGKSRRRASRVVSYAQDAITNDDKDDDPDFAFVDGADDDNFREDEEAPKKSKKGKGKAKARISRMTTTYSEDPIAPIPDGVNPQVMLISLKAGALGLNLTVANNVYL